MHSNAGRYALALFALACALAACGGGGGSSSGASGVSPITASPSSSPEMETYTTTLSSGDGVVSGTVTVDADASVTATASLTSPTGVAKAHRAITGLTADLYLAVIAESGTAAVAGLSASIVLATTPATPLSLYIWENGAWTKTNAAVTVNDSEISFSVALSSATATPVDFAIYSGTPAGSPAASASASPAPTSSAAATPNACAQTPNPADQSGGVSNQPGAFFSALESAREACVSVYTPSSQLMTAMETALQNGADLTVILPAEEYTDETGNATTLTNDGAHVIWLQDTDSPEYTIAATPPAEAIVKSYLPIHAKFAIVDGAAYMDGHNWFQSNPADVILEDQNVADYGAIQTDLTTFPSSPPTVTGSNYVFTTDKGNSLTAETSVLASASPGPGDTVDYQSESFDNENGHGANGAQVYSALIAAAKAGATVDVIVEGPVTNSYEECDLEYLAYYGAHTYVQDEGGAEKILLVSNSSGTVIAAWIGSSNTSDYDYIDWGMTIPTSNTGVIQAIQTNYDTQLDTWASPSPSPAPVTAPSCTQ